MTNPFRIVALADSLALPREEGDEILRWEETWPYRLEQGLAAEGFEVEVINCGARARTSHDLINGEFNEHIKFKRPHLVITQFGVTDCLPRIFSPLEKRLMNLPGFPRSVRDWLIQDRSRRRAEITRRDPLRRVHVRPDRFEAHFKHFCSELRRLPWKVDLVVLPILTHPVRMEVKSPRQSENVRRYNEILQRTCALEAARFCDPTPFAYGAVDEHFFRDGYHLTAEGSRFLTARLLPIVRSTLKERAKRS